MWHFWRTRDRISSRQSSVEWRVRISVVNSSTGFTALTTEPSGLLTVFVPSCAIRSQIVGISGSWPRIRGSRICGTPFHESCVRHRHHWNSQVTFVTNSTQEGQRLLSKQSYLQRQWEALLSFLSVSFEASPETSFGESLHKRRRSVSWFFRSVMNVGYLPLPLPLVRPNLLIILKRASKLSFYHSVSLTLWGPPW